MLLVSLYVKFTTIKCLHSKYFQYDKTINRTNQHNILVHKNEIFLPKPLQTRVKQGPVSNRSQTGLAIIVQSLTGLKPVPSQSQTGIAINTGLKLVSSRSQTGLKLVSSYHRPVSNWSQTNLKPVLNWSKTGLKPISTLNRPVSNGITFYTNSSIMVESWTKPFAYLVTRWKLYYVITSHMSTQMKVQRWQENCKRSCFKEHSGTCHHCKFIPLQVQ